MFSIKRSPDFETTVRPELPVLYRVARRLTLNPDEAEDIVQQTLLKAFGAWQTFDGRFLRSWLIRILRNEFLMTRRREVAVWSLEVVGEETAVAEDFWNESLWKMQSHQIFTAIDQLPENYRVLVQMCDVEDMTYEEAADALSIPVGTVRSRLFRARERLRRSLTPFVGLVQGGER